MAKNEQIKISNEIDNAFLSKYSENYVKTSRHMNSEQAPSYGKRTRAMNDVAVAALSVGTGLGVSWAGVHAPFVATSGVLASALLTRFTYGREIDRLTAEVCAAKDEIATVSRLNQAQIDALTERLEATNSRIEGKAALLATMSHEIRSPLSAVIALGDLLRHTPMSPEQRDLVEQVHDAGEMILGVVNDTLDLQKAEAEKLAFDLHPFSLRDLLMNLERYGRLLTKSKPAVMFKVGPAPIDQALGDARRLQQVLVNLSTNAIKFTDSGLVEVSVYVDEAGNEGQYLTFQVRDSGPGLTQEQQTRLFEPFAQVHSHRFSNPVGTGLGLYLSRKFVALMGGEIGVKSEGGRGAEFWFRIPLRVETGIDPQPHTSPESIDASYVRGLRRLKGRAVWVVDDSRLGREVARRVLEAEGAECLMFDSAEALIAHLERSPRVAGVVLMDIELRQMDGLTAAQWLKGHPNYSGLPIIAVSGCTPDEVELAVQAGLVDAYLPKPFHARTLIEEVLRHLPGQHQVEQEATGRGPIVGQVGVQAGV
jgi:signal transduction histidine kinase/ActR/RegA family two-component response regulator